MSTKATQNMLSVYHSANATGRAHAQGLKGQIEIKLFKADEDSQSTTIAIENVTRTGEKREDALINITYEGGIWSGTPSQLREQLTPRFPNGFTSWMDTHFEVVSYLTTICEKEGSIAYTTQAMSGTGALYDLAETITAGFEEAHKGREWDGDYLEELENYLEEVERNYISNAGVTD